MEHWLAVARYNLPIFSRSEVSHYIRTKVVWVMTILDDGFRRIDLADITMKDKDYAPTELSTRTGSATMVQETCGNA